jgi:predicted nuclease with TOPRIM domain
VHKLADKLSHYDDRLAEVNAQYDNLAQKVETLSRIEISEINNQLEDMSEQLENLAYVDIPDLQSQVDSMGEDVVGLSSASSAAAAAAEVVRQGNLREVGMEEERRVLVQKEAEEQVKSLKELVQGTYSMFVQWLSFADSWFVVEMKELRDATKAQMLNSVNELKETCKTSMDEVTSELVKAKEALAAAVAAAIAEVRNQFPSFLVSPN